VNSQEKQLALDAIAKEIASCRICKRDKVGVAVSGEGNPDADVVFIGEAPGKQEAKTGRPFIGRSGKLLREMIRKVGLKEEDVFITSPVKYLPKHVTPTKEEVAHGRTHLFAQFDVIQPKIIVLLGRVAALAVLEENIEVAKMHGTTIERNGRTFIIFYHPAAILYSRRLLPAFEKDFLKLTQLTKKL